MTTSVTYYDSSQRRRPVLTEFSNLWGYRGLVRLLVARDLTVRYKRSTLGVWWTLLNPLLTTGVLWIVFGNFFRFEIPGGIPFVVYLLSGILLVTYFAQATVASGSAIVNNSKVLGKVYVPAEVFSFASSASAFANFLISLLPLLIIQIATGVGIPWTAPLAVLPALLMLALVTGLGLLIASAAVHFYDVLTLTGVFVQLISYLTPTFYPLAIVPEGWRIFIYLNPLYSYLVVFRGFIYEGSFAPGWNFAVMGVSALVSLYVGVLVFSRSWKSLVVNL